MLMYSPQTFAPQINHLVFIPLHRPRPTYLEREGSGMKSVVFFHPVFNRDFFFCNKTYCCLAPVGFITQGCDGEMEPTLPSSPPPSGHAWLWPADPPAKSNGDSRPPFPSPINPLGVSHTARNSFVPTVFQQRSVNHNPSHQQATHVHKQPPSTSNPTRHPPISNLPPIRDPFLPEQGGTTAPKAPKSFCDPHF